MKSSNCRILEQFLDWKKGMTTGTSLVIWKTGALRQFLAHKDPAGATVSIRSQRLLAESKGAYSPKDETKGKEERDRDTDTARGREREGGREEVVKGRRNGNQIEERRAQAEVLSVIQHPTLNPARANRGKIDENDCI